MWVIGVGVGVGGCADDDDDDDVKEEEEEEEQGFPAATTGRFSDIIIIMYSFTC